MESTTISSLILAADAGESSAGSALFSALYEELHRMARRELARNPPGFGLGATSLLHEAYLDIARREQARFPDRGRFMAYAARVMRSLIVDHARARQAQKRGGQFEFTALDAEPVDAADGRELSRLSDALDELSAIDPDLAGVVDLKFFCGFSFVEIAAMHGITEKTVRRHWDKARIYLRRALRRDALA